jgi:hypothetical protein
MACGAHSSCCWRLDGWRGARGLGVHELRYRVRWLRRGRAPCWCVRRQCMSSYGVLAFAGMSNSHARLSTVCAVASYLGLCLATGGARRTGRRSRCSVGRMLCVASYFHCDQYRAYAPRRLCACDLLRFWPDCPLSSGVAGLYDGNVFLLSTEEKFSRQIHKAELEHRRTTLRVCVCRPCAPDECNVRSIAHDRSAKSSARCAKTPILALRYVLLVAIPSELLFAFEYASLQGDQSRIKRPRLVSDPGTEGAGITPGITVGSL